ncbi:MULTISPECIES: hypothetical protein [Agrobacterium]|uniref:Uncharacterized protein n=1 Tax=Agrobacterium tumefaciens TaxID=358 RepID=A0AAF0KB64_AGRTU|nr:MULTISPECIES: hypothetical protein [Agrobacterium]WGM61764.1 hypothetical protein CFBP5506_19290 [Agrobacterium tumefaciens]
MPILRTLDGMRVTATDEQLVQFRAWLAVDDDLDIRISKLFWLDMYLGYTVQNLNCVAVMSAIRDLEAGEPHTGVKKATPFNHPPLKGLWHKHYYSAQALIPNVIQGLGSDGLEKLANEIMDQTAGTVVTEQMCNELACRAIFEPLTNRSSNGKLTGEWVIFAKSERGNYYLSLGYHNTGDQLLYDRIMTYCPEDFPDLHKWII